MVKNKRRNNALKISVIIPTLNEEKYIDTTLFHIKKQNPYEIIIGDSHSNDKTVRIAKKYGAKIVYAPKGSASLGRNAGAKIAKGDVLLFLDADTIAYPNLIDVIKEDFKNRHVVGWTCKFFAFSPKWREHALVVATSNLIEFLVKHVKPHAAGLAMAIRKSAFERVNGFDGSMKVVDDHDMAVRVAKYGKFKFSDKTCVFTSTRRLQRGSWNLVKKYSKLYLSYMLKGKKFRTNEISYEPIR